MRFIEIIFIFLLLPIVTWAGGWTSGGGIGVKCQEAKSDSTQILDLYEGLHVWNLQPLPMNLSVESEIQEAVFRWLYTQVFPTVDLIKNPIIINEWKKQEANRILEDFNRNVVWIKNGAPIPPTNDATKPRLPKNCSFIQIALLKPTGQILIDNGLWSQLDNRNKAALILHESFYKITLDLGELNSDTTRQFNAMIFSQTQPTRKFFDIPLNKVILCTTKKASETKYTEFYYYYSNQAGSYIANFNQIFNSGFKPFRTIAKLEAVNLLDLSDNFIISSTSLSELESQRYNLTLSKDSTGLRIQIIDKKRNISSLEPFSCKEETVLPQNVWE